MTSKSKNLHVYSRLQIAAQLMRKHTDREMVEAAGITAAQLGVLNRVNAAKDVRQTSLARDLRLNDSAITAMVRRLIGLGMLEKTRCESDSRAWTLRVTPPGLTAIDRANTAIPSINKRIDAAIPDKALEEFVARLTQLIDLCEQDQAAENEA